MDNFYSIITQLGKEREVEALADGLSINLTQFVIGDANGQAINPNVNQTKLINEKYRGEISALTQSPDQASQLMAKLVLPPEIGGFTVREIGLLTDKDELYAVASCAAIEKPKGGVSIHIQFRLAVSDTAAISLNVATGEGLFLRIDQALTEIAVLGVEMQQRARSSLAIVNAGVGKRGLVALSDDSDSDDDETAVTPSALKSVKIIAQAAAKTVNHKLPDEEGNILLGSAANADLIASEEQSLTGQVLTVGDFGLGVKRGTPVGINFATYVFHSGAHLLLDMARCQNASLLLSGTYFYAQCLGVDEESQGCSVLFVDCHNKNRTYIGCRINESTEWNIIPLANLEDLTAYLPLSGGQLSGDLTIVGNHSINSRTFIEKFGVSSEINQQRYTNGLRINGHNNLKAEIFHLENIGQFHCLALHLVNGGSNGWFEFRNDGALFTTGGASFGGNIVLNQSGQGHIYQTNGDIIESDGEGSIFRAFWNSKSLYGALYHLTNRANDAWDKSHDAQVNRVQDIRLAGISYMYAGKNTGQSILPSGAVFIGCQVNGEWDNDEGFYYTFIQKCINGNWVTIGRA